MKKTLLVDFDGVCHTYTSGWKGETIIADPPVDGAFDWIREVVSFRDDQGELGFEVAIYSSRSKNADAVVAMKSWFRKWGLEREVLDQLTFPTEKPPGWITIDDRAFCFEGVFPSVKYLLNFKPWNKR